MNALILIMLMTGFSFGKPNSTPTVETGKVILIMENLEPNKGEIRSAIYKKEGFLDKHGHIEDSVLPMGDFTTKTVVFDNLPYGDYVLAAYQDLDTSHKLSSNMIGVPNEPYAFSKTPGSKWRKPNFEECSFKLDQSEVTVTLKLKYWKQY